MVMSPGQWLQLCFKPTDVEIGLEQTEYPIHEDSTEGVSVCALLSAGTLERNVTVILQTQTGTASLVGMFI